MGYNLPVSICPNYDLVLTVKKVAMSVNQRVRVPGAFGLDQHSLERIQELGMGTDRHAMMVVSMIDVSVLQ